jgi:hypothetical protein
MTEIVFALSSIVPVAAGFVKENAVMAFASESGMVRPPPPLHAGRKIDAIKNNDITLG